MEKQIADNRIHSGHRERMRKKLIAHGQRIFDTYELLEMLLYYTVPCRDTNPISKRLLYAFGDLEGVFSADMESLLRVKGVGLSSAELIHEVNELSGILGTEILPEHKNIFKDYHRMAKFLIDYFEKYSEKRVTAIFLDNNMRLISIEDIACGTDYESAAIKPAPFVDKALKLHASAVITAHNHPFSSPYPTPGDRATNALLKSALDGIKVTLAEHFVISGDKYIGIMQGFSKNFCQSPLLDEFLKGRGDGETVREISGERVTVPEDYYNVLDFDYFANLLSFTGERESGEKALELLRAFHTIENVVTATPERLSHYVKGSTVVFFKLIGYLTSRRVLDRFEFGKKHTSSEIADYFKALFIGLYDEHVYVMCLDSKDRAIACEHVSEGIVNNSEVIPRKLLELVLLHSAKRVIIAHNHPFGNHKVSREDIAMTSYLSGILGGSNISLVSHYVVAGQRCAALNGEGVSIAEY